MGSSDASTGTNEPFRAIFDSSLDAMLLADDTGRYLDGNPAALTLLRVTIDELRRTRVHDLSTFPPSMVDAAWTAFLHDGKQEGEFQLRRSDGATVVVEFRAVANVMPGRHLSVLRDVTERYKAEETKRRLAAIVESAGDAIFGGKLDGILDYWSPSAERLFGYSAAEIIGQTHLTLVPPERTNELSALYATLARGESIRNFETVRLRKDGSRFEVAMTLSPTTVNGQTIGIYVIARDLSEKKELERRLALADRMASIGTLAAGVAHEINNPLAAVMGNLEYLARELASLVRDGGAMPSVSALEEPLNDVRVAADRIREVVRDLKMFSRPDEQRRGFIDVRRLIESTLQMASTEIRHRARLVKDYGAVPPVYGNDARLGQVILNLVVNAAHAIREGNAENNEIRVVTRTHEGGGAVVEVHDTGAGIATEDLPKVFEPFFTTKAIGSGTGLGLSICHRIVHEMGGDIFVESELGKWTTFRVHLPPAPADVVEAPPCSVKVKAPTRRGRILVVDDEPMVVNAVLRSLGNAHDVKAVLSAQGALDRIGAGERYDVIVCDLMMPQMTGMDLFAELSTIAPDQAERMIFMTAAAFTPRARDFLDSTPNQRLEKPFDSIHFRTLIDDRVR